MIAKRQANELTRDEILPILYSVRIALGSIFVRINAQSNNLALIQEHNKKMDIINDVRDRYRDERIEEISKNIDELLPLSEYRRSAFLQFLGVVFMLIVIGAGIFVAYNYYASGGVQRVQAWSVFENAPFGIVPFLLSYLSGALLAILIIFAGYIINNLYKVHVQEVVERRSWKKRDKKIEKQREQELRKHLEGARFQNEIAKYTDQQNAAILKYSTAVVNIINENKKLQQEANGLYQKLMENYGSIISPVDWKYIDSLIYYFETGRTDTVKEALVLLESQIQANMLKNTIELGHKQIVSQLNALQTHLKYIEQGVRTLSVDLYGVKEGIRNLAGVVTEIGITQNELLRDITLTQRIASAELVHALENSQTRVDVTVS